MQNVLYIHPKCNNKQLHFPYIPVGVVGLANLLRQKNYCVIGINCVLETYLDNGFDLRARLKSINDLLFCMIDLHWYEHAFGAIEVSKIVKDVYPDLPIVIGGLTSTIYCEEILRNFNSIDFIIQGEAEKPLLQLASKLKRKVTKYYEIPNLVFKKDGKIIKNTSEFSISTKMFNNLNFVDLDFMDNWEIYSKVRIDSMQWGSTKNYWLEIGRGCIYNCVFCGMGKGNIKECLKRNEMILRSPKTVVSDVALLAQMGYETVSFTHDIVIDPKWFNKFIRLLSKDVFKNIGFYNEFWQNPTETQINEICSVADPARSKMNFSPLTGSEEIRVKYGKKFSNKSMIDNICTLNASGMCTDVFFSTNLPFENIKTRRMTLDLVDELISRCSNHSLLGIYDQGIVLDPKCVMYKKPIKFGINSTYRSFSDYYNRCKKVNNARLTDRDYGFNKRNLRKPQGHSLHIRKTNEQINEKMVKCIYEKIQTYHVEFKNVVEKNKEQKNNTKVPSEFIWIMKKCSLKYQDFKKQLFFKYGVKTTSLTGMTLFKRIEKYLRYYKVIS